MPKDGAGVGPEGGGAWPSKRKLCQLKNKPNEREREREREGESEGKKWKMNAKCKIQNGKWKWAVLPGGEWQTAATATKSKNAILRFYNTNCL